MKLELFQKHCKEKRTRKNVHRLEVTLLKETRRLLTGFKIFFVSRAASTGNSASSLASKDQRQSSRTISRRCPRPVAADWSYTGYWTRLTPNPGNSLGFIVWNCCVGGELVQHNAQLPPAETSHRLSSRCTRARNRVLHASCGAGTAAVYGGSGILCWATNNCRQVA